MRQAAGFTLVELAVALALLALLASLALPGWRGQQQRAARLDGVAALMQLQAAQEQHRQQHGLYAPSLDALPAAPRRSAQGYYQLSLALDGPDGYSARAVAEGSQAADSDCAALTLRVAQGFASQGPTPGCWMR